MSQQTSEAHSSPRFAHIDALRAIAVLIVVVAHAGLGQVVPGGSGVTIFFAISGYIITHILLKERYRTGMFDIRSFYIKRALKIFPPVIALLIIPTLIFSIFERVNWAAFLAQIFFVFNWFQIDNVSNILPGSGIIWSLAIEEQFYIVFALFWICAARLKKYFLITTILASIIVVTSLSIRIWLVSQGGEFQDRIYFGTDTRMDGIAIGILFALAAARKRAVNLSVRSRFQSGDWMIIGGVILFLVGTMLPGEQLRYTLRFSVQATAAAMIIYAGMVHSNSRLVVFMMDLSKIKIVRILGLASYSIYLAHFPVFSLLNSYVNHLSDSIEICIKIFLGVLVGVFVWKFLELPVERYKNSKFRSIVPKRSQDQMNKGLNSDFLDRRNK